MNVVYLVPTKETNTNVQVQRQVKCTRTIRSEQVLNAFVEVVRKNLPLDLKNTDSRGFCGFAVFAQPVHEPFGRLRAGFSRIHEYRGENSGIRGSFVDGWRLKPQNKSEPGNCKALHLA
ncbi:MAG: hypothetical protein QMD04_10185 [Anaerolineales bacterium]|nr:hypothetical protein [Anaerolineales bacterium]